MTAPFPTHYPADRRGQRLGLAVVAVLVTLLAALTTLLVERVMAGPPERPLAALPAAPLLSQVEEGGNVSLGRDCGYSAPLPADSGESLWLFCDTPEYARQANGNPSTWKIRQFIPGSTAALDTAMAGPGQGITEPGPLTEAGTPRRAGSARGLADPPAASGVLAPFLAAPSGLFTSTGHPCGLSSGSYAASWVSGVTQVGSGPVLLITFNDYCVLIKSGRFEAEGFGLAEYDPRTRTLSHEVTVFDGPPEDRAGPLSLGSPVFYGGYLYLFANACATPAHGRCAGTLIEARVPANPLAWADPLSYQWHSTFPSGPWTSNPGAATPLIAGPGPVTAVDVADFASAGHHLVAIEQIGIEGSFTAYQAPAPGGPWTEITSGRVACRGAHASFCRAIIGHPELSTRAELVLSYFDPAVGPGGHVMVEGFRWPPAAGASRADPAGQGGSG